MKDYVSELSKRKHPWDPKRKINSLCSTCNEDFGGVTAFDMHRVGKHEAVASPEFPEGRRCLNREEMLGRKMRLDMYGRWRGPGRNTPPWERAATDPDEANGTDDSDADTE